MMQLTYPMVVELKEDYREATASRKAYMRMVEVKVRGLKTSRLDELAGSRGVEADRCSPALWLNLLNFEEFQPVVLETVDCRL